MTIEIFNCNNIDNGLIELREKRLNIKYAINGTGKSTIAKALSYSVSDLANGGEALSNLTPFKFLEIPEEAPRVTGTAGIKKLRVFDEAYVDEFVFQPDELLKGSFDIFVRDSNYEKGIREIEALVEEVKALLSEDKEIEALIADLTELSGGFGKPTKNGIHGSSTLAKALKEGNKVANIPSGLEVYKDYIQRPDNFRWIKWQLEGKPFIDVAENCPYCVGDIKEKKETIRKVSDVYDSKSVESLNKIVAVFQRLNQYFSDQTKSIIAGFIANTDGYTDDQISFLREVRDQIDRLIGRFSQVRAIGFNSLKEVDKVSEVLKSYTIDLKLFNHLQSEATLNKANLVNSSIERVLEKVGLLQGSIKKQKILIERLVKDNNEEINSFLKNAGYSYKVDIRPDESGEYRLKLVHVDVVNEVEDVRAHLSFGERNAFALVLFMYDVLKSSPDVIVLDDPISSFDKNKKYAILEMLFRREKSFREKTVLLLTHDFEPVVDMVLHHTDRFEKPFAAFLENRHGQVFESEIRKSDIATFITVNECNILEAEHVLSKLVYLRRLFEVTKEKGPAYHVLSSLFHKRAVPTIPTETGPIAMPSEQLATGNAEIAERIGGYSYEGVLRIVQDDKKLKELYRSATSNYEKLHIYRILFDDKPEPIRSDVIHKFINEAFHLETDYIYQINPRKYQLVPQYVIDECNAIIGD